MCTYINIRPSYEPSQDLHQQHQGDNLGDQGGGRRPSMNGTSRNGGSTLYTSQYPHTQSSQMSQPYSQQQQLQLQQQGAMYQLSGSSPYSLQHGVSGSNLGIVGVGGGYGFDNRSHQHQNASYNQQQMMQQQQQQQHGFGAFRSILSLIIFSFIYLVCLAVISFVYSS